MLFKRRLGIGVISAIGAAMLSALSASAGSDDIGEGDVVGDDCGYVCKGIRELCVYGACLKSTWVGENSECVIKGPTCSCPQGTRKDTGWKGIGRTEDGAYIFSCIGTPTQQSAVPAARPNEFERVECDEAGLPGSLYTTGPVRSYCRQTSRGYVQFGGGRRAGPFTLVVIACGRGQDERFAQHNAGANAARRISDLQSKKRKEVGGRPESNEIFIQDGFEERCSPNPGDLN